MNAAPISGRDGPYGTVHGSRGAGARRRSRRARPMIALAVISFAVGAIVGAAHTGSASAPALASRFVAAWARGDYASMYSEITPAAQREIAPGEFVAAYREAAMLATASKERAAGRARAAADGVEVVPVQVVSRLFGTLDESFRLPIVAAGGSGEGAGEPRVEWSRWLVFPGLRAGERLSRRTNLPPRAALLARDGSVLAEGAASAAGQRSSPLGAAASAVVGSVGAVPASRRAALEAQGIEADAIVGVSGLELADDERLRGIPGGELLAGARVLASVPPRAAAAVRTTISPAVQSAAVSALGGQYGGVVAMEPASGQVLAVAGIGLEALQPPGSTFKMITVSGALQAGVASAHSTYPYATAATLDGVQLHNANGESCGGSLVLAFAVSCNSVFSPLGVKLGATRLVAMAERFGFNQAPGVAGAAESTIPPAAAIQGELAVGSTAIGQDMVQATALEMATVAATIADGGRRPTPSFAFARGTSTRAISAGVARMVRGMMIDVVRFGTGTAAAIPGVVVAGKTGTAELGSPSSCASSDAEADAEQQTTTTEGEAAAANCGSEQSDPQNTDAWFATFAPALHPKIVVGVLMVRDGAGGATAAPVARQVLEAGLKASS
jgi:peptidoglycan glycosyltransferase